MNDEVKCENSVPDDVKESIQRLDKTIKNQDTVTDSSLTVNVDAMISKDINHVLTPGVFTDDVITEKRSQVNASVLTPDVGNVTVKQTRSQVNASVLTPEVGYDTVKQTRSQVNASVLTPEVGKDTVKQTHSQDIASVLTPNVSNDTATHTRPRLRRPRCDTCDKTFSSPRYLKRHCNAFHSGKQRAFNIRRDKTESEKNPEKTKIVFTCYVCYKDFTSNSLLYKHKCLDADVNGFQCEKCEKRFSSDKHLKRHKYMHSRYTEHYACNFCRKHFSFPFLLDDHIRNEHAEETVFTSKPHDGSSSSLNVGVARKRKQPQNRKLSKQLLLQKQKSISLKNNVSSFSTNNETSVDTTSVERDIKKAFCDACDKSFSNIFYLKRHNNRFHKNLSSTENEVSSKIKPKLHKQSLTTLRRSVHDQSQSSISRDISKPYLYEQSDSRYVCVDTEEENYPVYILVESNGNKEPLITQHEFVRSADNNKTDQLKAGSCGGNDVVNKTGEGARTGYKFVCKICKKTFNRPWYLKRHQNRYHSQNVNCEICNKTFTASSYLKRHQRRFHVNLLAEESNKATVKTVQLNSSFSVDGTQSSVIDSSFECKQCDICFNSVSDLEDHRNTCSSTPNTSVSDSRPLVSAVKNEDSSLSCVQCNKAFSHAVNLKRHMVKVHPTETLFKCHECNSFFSADKYLKRHNNRYHNGVPSHEKNETFAEKSQSQAKSHKPADHTGDVTDKNNAQTINTTELESKNLLIGSQSTISQSNTNFVSSSLDQTPAADLSNTTLNTAGVSKEYKAMSSPLNTPLHAITCTICVKSFSRPQYLNRHNNRYHNNLKETKAAADVLTAKDVKINTDNDACRLQSSEIDLAIESISSKTSVNDTVNHNEGCDQSTTGVTNTELGFTDFNKSVLTSSDIKFIDYEPHEVAPNIINGSCTPSYYGNVKQDNLDSIKSLPGKVSIVGVGKKVDKTMPDAQESTFSVMSLQCPICEENFNSRVLLSSHHKRRHPGADFIVPVPSKLSFEESEALHKNILYCKICEKVFNHKQYLTRHNNRYHGSLINLSGSSIPASHEKSYPRLNIPYNYSPESNTEKLTDVSQATDCATSISPQQRNELYTMLADLSKVSDDLTKINEDISRIIDTRTAQELPISSDDTLLIDNLRQKAAELRTSTDTMESRLREYNNNDTNV